MNIEISPKNIAIICRSKGLIAHILGDPSLSEWTTDYNITYPLVHACFLYTNGSLKKAFHVIEKVVYYMTTKANVIDSKALDEFRNRYGILEYRSFLHDFLKRLPSANGNLGTWVDVVNKQINSRLSISDEARAVPIGNLFSTVEKEALPFNYTIGTVHSVKGETFEAVLLFLKTRGVGRNYTTLISKNISTEEEEELRIVYVGITRPRKLLLIATPNETNLTAWKGKLSK